MYPKAFIFTKHHCPEIAPIFNNSVVTTFDRNYIYSKKNRQTRQIIRMRNIIGFHSDLISFKYVTTVTNYSKQEMLVALLKLDIMALGYIDSNEMNEYSIQMNEMLDSFFLFGSTMDGAFALYKSGKTIYEQTHQNSPMLEMSSEMALLETMTNNNYKAHQILKDVVHENFMKYAAMHRD